MDEFRKPFEYEEEKRGFILVFIFMLIIVDVIQTLSLTTQVYKIFKQNSVLKNGFMVAGVLFLLYVLYTAITCYRLSKNMVTIAKSYLIVRVIFSALLVVIVYINAIKNENLIGNGIQQYKTEAQMVLEELLIPLGYVFVFSIIWYVYFLKSKRCKEFLKNIKRV